MLLNNLNMSSHHQFVNMFIFSLLYNHFNPMFGIVKNVKIIYFRNSKKCEDYIYFGARQG